MKKLTLSVAALSIALTTFGQVNTTDVVLPEYEVREMVNTIDDILEWQQEDIEQFNGEGLACPCGSYEEGWGSNYWLTIMREELIIAINSSRLK
jgi:hypothetical protein